MIEAVLSLTILVAIAAAGLVLTRRYNTPDDQDVVQQINALLPQTQCAQCGYPGCLPYAQAVAGGEAINRCPPGGEQTIAQLSHLLGREVLALDPVCGENSDPMVAVIREAECIGCTLCLPACPVDAIIGSTQLMHTVIADACTGCDLCREPCPVDCIDLVPVEITSDSLEFHDGSVACINCGDCITVCPRDLQPQLLNRYRDKTDQFSELKLDDCIECRRCDAVCPSEIPLTNNFRASKQLKAASALQNEMASVAKFRFERHESRIAGLTKRVRKRPSKDDRAQLLADLKGQP